MARDYDGGVITRRKSSKKKRTSSKKKKSAQPAVRHLRFLINNSGTPDTETSHFVDIAQALSVVNRRMYRQGMNYTIKKISVTSRDTTNGLISVSAAPTSWMVHAAWKQSFKLWNQMRQGHGGAPGSGLPQGVTPATWADYKVYLSNDHRTSGTLVPVDNGNNAAVTTNAEWQHARFISPDGTTSADEFTAHLLGDDVGVVGAYTSVGIVQGYEESRRTVQQDETSSEINTDSWMINLFDDGTTLDEIAQDLKEDGDFPPYQYNQYSGGATNMPKPLVQQIKALVPNGAGPSTTSSIVLGEIVAPCGLLEIEVQSGVASDIFDVLIEVAPGTSKGVKASPM